MTQSLNFSKDEQGTPAYAADFPTVRSCVLLAASGNATYTVPSDSNYTMGIIYSTIPDVWICVNGNAVPPTLGTFSDTGSISNFGQIKVKANDTVNFYNASSASIKIGLVLYPRAD